MGTQTHCAGAPTCVSASVESGLPSHTACSRASITRRRDKSKSQGQSPHGVANAMSDDEVSDTAQLITPDTVEALGAVLINLSVGRSVYITADDFKKLSGDDISEFASEGRLMMGNLCARTNCTIETNDGRAVFTKNPARTSAPLSLIGGSV